MCSSTSPRFFAASTINSSRSRTFIWPVNSLKAGGRSEISKAASGSGGFIRTSDDLITLVGEVRTVRVEFAWVAHASRVLVSASGRNNLCYRYGIREKGCLREKFAIAGRSRQHARRVRY